MRLPVRSAAALAMMMALGAHAQHAVPEPFAATGTVQVAFTPWDDAEGLIVSAIGEARRQILVQAFSFTSRRIAAALVIDGESREPTVITGSYNWSGGAQRRNAENVLVLRRNRELARAYFDNWLRRRADARPYLAKGRR